MKRMYCFSLALFFVFGTLAAQSSIGYADFERLVLAHSHSLGKSKAQLQAMKQAVKLAHTALFPSVDASGNYRYSFSDNHLRLGTDEVSLKPASYQLDLSVSQPLYAGGSLYYAWRAARVQAIMAHEAVRLAEIDVIYAAENGYWYAVAQKQMYDMVCRYVRIIEQQTSVLQEKYDAGYIARTDLLQMQNRLMEARLQRSSLLQTYKVALQHLNVMMGLPAMHPLEVSDSIFMPCKLPSQVPLQEVLSERPDYRMALAEVDYQRHRSQVEVSKYNPSLSVGFTGSWGTPSLNVSGDASWGSAITLTFSLPLFHWGARAKSKASQKALVLMKEFARAEMFERVSREVAESWTALTETTHRITLAADNARLAEENLSLNTFSYNEGRLTILDVLSAQVSWMQAYTQLIQVYYEQKLSLADYRHATGGL